jgi:hypothetical protein
MLIKRHLIQVLTLLRYIIGTSVALGFLALPFYLIFFLKVTQGFYIGALIWSFFVLCFPFGITSSLFNIPFWFALGKSFPFAEVLSWIIALSLNYYTYFYHPTFYFRFATTHMLHQIISHPWPCWLIIASCGLAMIFRTVGRYTVRPRSFLLFHFINLVLIMISFTLLSRLAYHELVIILNIQA